MYIKLLLIVAISESLIMFVLEYLKLPAFYENIVDTISLSLAVAFFSKKLIFDKISTLTENNLESALAKVEALNKAAIVSVTDPNGKITSINSLFCEISGYQREELLGADHRILNSNFHSKEFMKELWSTINSGQIWKGEIRNKNKNGEYYWVFSNIVPIISKDTNKIQSFLSIRFDITEKKQLEEAFKEEHLKTLHLEKLSSIGELSANIAHEINNPLAIVSGKLDIIKRKLGKVPNLGQFEIEKDFDKLDLSISRIVKIIKNLREFSRQDGTEDSASECDFKLILDSTLDLIGEKAKLEQVTIDTSLASGQIYCIPTQIEQVLVNLINNSIYEAKKLNEKWIKIEAKNIEKCIEISVTDSGLGIPEDIQKKLMLPFFTTKPVGQGTGLGLNVAKKIIESNSGKFYYDKAYPNTRFVIRLPAFKNASIGIVNIDDAIAAHLKWKQKISDELRTKSKSIDPDHVKSCEHCELGKWIKKNQDILGDNEFFKKLHLAHNNFHMHASEMVRGIHSGSLKSLDGAFDEGSGFARTSNEIIVNLNLLMKDQQKTNLNPKQSA